MIHLRSNVHAGSSLVYSYIDIHIHKLSIITSSDTQKTVHFTSCVSWDRMIFPLPSTWICCFMDGSIEDSDALTDGFKMRRGAIEAGVSLITDIKTVPWQLRQLIFCGALLWVLGGCE